MVQSSNKSSRRKKQPNVATPEKATPEKEIDWLDTVNNCIPQLAIPVGPRFQADVPAWTGSNHYNGQSDKDSLKWLGTQVWPTKGRIRGNRRNAIGKGRPDFCKCVSPGSVECIRHHISDGRIKLQYDLGPAFWSWKFDEMGEEVSRAWTLEEQRNFVSLVKMNPLSQGKSFLKPAIKCFSSKSTKDIVSYYFNVFVPRRISMNTRLGCKVEDSDDDEETREGLGVRGSQKRCRADNDVCQVDDVVLHGSPIAKTRYLAGSR